MISPETIEIDLTKVRNQDLEYGSENGHFFNFNLNRKLAGELYGCRELFARALNKNIEYVGFNCSKQNLANRVNLFFEKREQKLGIPAEERSIIIETNKPNVIILKFAKFWTTNSTRKSVFTLFLRMAAVYYKNDYKNAIEQYYLARETKIALDWFMDGNTFPLYKQLRSGNYGNGGWHSKFKNKDKEYLEKSLIKPNSGQNLVEVPI